jgi:membrane associated rhomboid family serine protease
MGVYDREYYRDQQEPGEFQAGQLALVTKLVILNGAVFLLDLLFGGEQHGLTRILAVTPDVLSQPWLWWKFLTYGFAHQSIDHVLWNMLGLWMLGREVEDFYGRKEFLRVYLAALVLGSVVWCLREHVLHGPAPGPSLVGASGAVTAIVLLFVFQFPKRTILLFMVVPVPAWILGTLIIGGDAFGSISRSPAGHVAYDVHLIGAAFAACYHFLGWNLGRWTPRLDWLRRPNLRLRRRPQLRIHEPEERAEPEDDEADRILAKVSREGLDRLTPGERRVLEAYSRRMREKHRS